MESWQKARVIVDDDREGSFTSTRSNRPTHSDQILGSVMPGKSAILPQPAGRPAKARPWAGRDMPAHIKSALTQTQLSIPVTDGRLQLGTWQGIFLLEHRASPHCRALILTLIGEEGEPARRSGERHCSG
jgi:hypothetical protein